MNGSIIQLLVLAAIAVFLFLRLRSVLGTRDGFEKPPAPHASAPERSGPAFEVIEGGVDRDITDNVEEGSASALALAEMKRVEPGFSVSEFLGGARSAYEMILMGFEKGDLAAIKPFLADDVYQSFAEVVEERNAQGLTIDATFVGVSELTLQEAEFDTETREAEITMRFVGEQSSVVRDRAGDIVEGDPNAIQRQRDVWTFARTMGSNDPNWHLVATGE